MEPNHMNDLDPLIDQALRDEPMHRVPSGFHRRLTERLRVAAIVQQERRHFHRRMASMGIVFGGLILAMVGLPVLAYTEGWVARSVPAGLGYLDYLTVSLVAGLGALRTGAIAVAVAAVVLAGAAALIPILKRRGANQN
jgi:hypothetical protein